MSDLDRLERRILGRRRKETRDRLIALLLDAEARAARAERAAAAWKQSAKLWKEASERHHRALCNALERETKLENALLDMTAGG